MSWAAIARKEAAEAPLVGVHWEEKPRVAVVDANAIISGFTLNGVAERAVTTQDVLNEIRDKKSRDWLQALPYKLDVMEACEDSVKAVTRFARLTGDLRNLSKVDLNVVALARDLEVKVYGDSHLKSEPKKAVVAPKTRSSAKPLPGWGTDSAAWAELDAMEGLSSAGGPASKVGAVLQNISRAAELPEERSADDAMQDEAQPMAAAETGEEEEEEDGSDDSGWEVAAKSKTAQRHKTQKAVKRAQRDDFYKSSEQQVQDDAEMDGREAEALEEEVSEDSQEQADETDFESCIASVTADFAMQNVLLQMGLRLVTPDGRRIREMHCWVLRCSACQTTSREIQRLFCPQCGNATLDKVELTIGPDGAEQYGVRKKHNLRGTRYSLPKPKGGKKCNDPILREDVLLSKAFRRRPKKTAVADDAWNTEFGATPATMHEHLTPGLQKGIAPLTNSWKNNPNERKHKASNRRRK